VVGTAELFCTALGFGDDCGGMVPANVVEGTQLSITATDNDDGLAGNIGSEKVALIAQLIEPANDLPSCAEDIRSLEFLHTGVAIPRRWDCRGPLERVGRIVEIQYVVNASLHWCTSGPWSLRAIGRRTDARRDVPKSQMLGLGLLAES
jgi:hypothetical protein